MRDKRTLQLPITEAGGGFVDTGSSTQRTESVYFFRFFLAAFLTGASSTATVTISSSILASTASLTLGSAAMTSNLGLETLAEETFSSVYSTPIPRKDPLPLEAVIRRSAPKTGRYSAVMLYSLARVSITNFGVTVSFFIRMSRMALLIGFFSIFLFYWLFLLRGGLS